MRTMTRMTTAAGVITTIAGLGLALLLGTPGVATAQGSGGTGCVSPIGTTTVVCGVEEPSGLGILNVGLAPWSRVT